MSAGSRWLGARLASIGLMLSIGRGAAAQVVRGSTVNRDGQPVPGVVVLLLDSASRISARALSNEAGAFRIVAPHAGTFRLRTLRIGFLPGTDEPLTVSADGESSRRLVLADLPMMLDTMHVTNTSVCGDAGSSTAAAFRVWDQARTALTAAELTTQGRALEMTMVSYDRSLDAGMHRIVDQTAVVNTEIVTQPWRTLPPDSLRAFGYVAADPDGQTTTYYAPGLDALTSPQFAEDHCFRLQASADSSRIGIAFEPTPERQRLAELRGTLWLDRRSFRLTDLEYQYANVGRMVASRAGGRLDFAPLTGGGWVITAWRIAMPVLALTPMPRTVQRTGSLLSDAPAPERVVGVHETGGVVAAVRRGADTLWAHGSVRLTGTVRDSLTDKPVPAAQIVADESGVPVVADRSGRFTIADLAPGSHLLEVRTTQLDSLGVAVRVSAVAIDSSTDIAVRVPNARAMAARLAARASALAGVVLSDSTQLPVVGAEVSIADLGVAARTDERGAFRLTRIPPGEHELVVRRVGFVPLDQRISFKPNTLVNRRILLDRVVRLDSVVVEASASAIPEFEEHRKLGLGHFMTRADMAKRETSHLSEVLETMPSVRILRNPKINQAYATRARGKLSVYPTGAQDVDGECYADVYLDGHPVYQKIGSGGMQKFDLNSISVDQIEAIEYYAGPSETPPKYSGLNSPCGVLVIWTRRTP